MSEVPFVNSIAGYLANTKCLLVEPSSAFIANISSSLISLGAKKDKIYTALRMEDALEIIECHKPTLIITEHQIGDKFGLDLIDKVDQLVGEQNRIAILATRNADITSVAEAAEEQIDAYILKPFSLGDFQKKLQDTILNKTKPSNYMSHIQSGKALLLNGELENASNKFNEAKKLHPKPSLAFYYCGLIQQKFEKKEQAIDEFKQGLALTPLHYRCLTAYFDALFQQQNFKVAYELIKPLRIHYPISSKRLGQIMICSIYCQHIEDMPEYFKLFSQIKNRTTDLIKVATASFKTAGKTMLKENQPEKALMYFEMGAISAQLDPEYLDGVVRDLLKARQPGPATELFKKYPRQSQSTDRYKMLGFLLECQTLAPVQVLDRGKKVMLLLEKGEPDFYRELVRIAKSLGKEMAAEDIINKAVTHFPDLRKELYALLN